MRIDEIIARLLPGIEERVFRANAEVTAAIVMSGWTGKRPTTPAPVRRRLSGQHDLFEQHV